MGVNVRWDKELDALKFMETYRVPFAVGQDGNGAAGRSYAVEATPVTYIIDRAGRVASGKVGATEAAELDRLIESSLTRS